MKGLIKRICILLLMACTVFAQNFGDLGQDPYCEDALDDHFRIMTFNLQVRHSVLAVGPWPRRLKLISNLLIKQKVDILGAQEVTPSMMRDLKLALPHFRSIGVGRNDGKDKGEYSPLFYNSERVKVVESGTFWLSLDPDAPGTIGWDARYPRIATWALFTEVASGQMFYVFNTHLDHLGVESRLQSVRLLTSRIRARTKGLPVILTGDYNFQPRSPEYNELIQLSGFQDAQFKGPHFGGQWTHSIYGFRKAKIDYVFVAPQIHICRHEIIPEDRKPPNGRSDHLPIVVEFSIVKPDAS